MALLDLSRAKAREVKVIRRSDCHTYERAYEYLQNTLADHKKAVAKTRGTGVEKPEHPWIVVGVDGKPSLRITLHSMPLYWSIEDTGKERTIYEPVDPGEGGNPNVSKKEAAKVPEPIGAPLYSLESYEEGEALADALMANEDADFKEILSRAARALKRVDTEEYPRINKQAEYWYNFKGHNKTHGPWGEKDEVTRVSQTKTRKMNASKITARNQLGYTRAGKANVVYR